MDMKALLDAPVAGPLSTTVKVPREGEYKAIIDDGEKAIQFRDGDASRNLSPQATVLFSILDENLKKELGRDKVLVPMTLWIDVTDSGALDLGEGKNVGFGRLFDAAGLNDAGGTFGDKISRLKGRGPFMVKVGQRSDKNDPNIKYAEVRKVAKLT